MPRLMTSEGTRLFIGYPAIVLNHKFSLLLNELLPFCLSSLPIKHADVPLQTLNSAEGKHGNNLIIQ